HQGSSIALAIGSGMGFFEPPLSNNAAIVLLVGKLLAEQTEEWEVIRRHMNQECLVQVVGLE
ncbi:hypothetical protein, partial [Serratia marcescens]|uniref:hypothetical protein n=1 Tax=Serratia marcescens TaxID=615 RepID=UPI0013DD8409